MLRKPLHAITGVAVFLLLIASTKSLANDASPTQISTEFGIGYESQSSPLVRISPEGTLINLSGKQNINSHYVRANIQGYSSWGMGEGWGVAAAGAATFKQAPNEKNFDFNSMSIQPSLYMAIGSASLGWGVALERLSVADKHFRDVVATQLNWTLADPAENIWALVGEFAENQHVETFSELNSNSTSLILQRHLNKPFNGIDGLDFNAYLERDRNKKGFDDLSYRNMMLTTSVQWRWLNIAWTASSTWQKTKFDAISFEQEPTRIDKSVGLGLTAEHELSTNNTLRVSYNNVHSVSTTTMFNNHYQQLEITICKTW